MEAAGGIVGIACILAFASAALLVPALVQRIGRVRAMAHAQNAALQGDGALARLFRNGVAPANALAGRLMANARFERYCRDMAWLARRRGLDTTAQHAGGVVLTATLLMLPLGCVASCSPLFGLMAAVCLPMLLGVAAKQGRDRQRDAMREEVPDILQSMSACFHAGYSLLQTFRHIAGEATGPLGQLFRRAESDLRTGHTATEALGRMREDSDLAELAFVAAALEIQHQTGGSLQKIIDSARESVEGELALRRSLRVQTAQARLSMRVVTVMPFVLIALFSLVSPGFLSPFFASPMGFAVFGLAMGMQAAGVLSVRRMLDVKEA